MRKRHYTGFWSIGAIIQAHILLLGIIMITGCNDSSNGSPGTAATTSPSPAGDPLTLSQLVEKMGQRLQGASGGVQQALGPQGEVIQERTKEEVEKLFRWEYKVVETESGIAAADFERRLGELGNEGWECFHISTSPEAARITCKRRPRSPLTYLQLIPGL
ncbi:MAG: hypothetical protein RL518_1123 [Pseudomonadota bacterium]